MGARAAAARLDAAQLTSWERSLSRSRLPSGGELTARLRRNGLTDGFTAYAAAQRRGAYGRRSFVPTEAHGIAERLCGSHPEAVERILATAEELAVGRLRIFGRLAWDLRRSPDAPGHALDWRLDPISGLRYVTDVSAWRFNPLRDRPGDADVKGPWEVTRAQHLATLGQAWWLTGDSRYPDVYAGTITDFIRHNPVGLGVHWACTMDVALRVVGWLVALPFFQGAGALDDRWWRRFLRSIVDHAEFILSHLEFGSQGAQIITSNHHLANLLGLWWIALTFPELDAGYVWRGVAMRGLEHEIGYQLQDDGTDFESSVMYHRLVTEMFLSAWALGAHRQVPLSDNYRDRLVAALRAVTVLRQPGGRVPQIGDADDGRAHILTDYDRWTPESMDHLLAAGARVLGAPDLAVDLDADARIEAIFWATPDPAAEQPIDPPAQLEVLPDLGVAVLRGGPTHLTFCNGPVGTLGVGNHKHNDQLAIELTVGTQPLIVDPGSYTYTQDPDARNRFRGVAAHSTVAVDGREHHLLNPEWLFRLDAAGESRMTTRRVGELLVAEGWFSGYERLDKPVTLRRRAAVHPDGVVVVVDAIDGAAGHELSWTFLLHPDVRVTLDGRHLNLAGPGGAATLITGDLDLTVVDAEYSHRYGQKTATSALVATRGDGPDSIVVVLVPEGGAVPAADKVAGIVGQPWEI